MSTRANIYLWLAKEIRAFLDQYAGVRPDYDPETEEVYERYTSPDAVEMLVAAEKLERGEKPERIFSEWESGGYKPYTSQEGRQKHDELIELIEMFHNLS